MPARRDHAPWSTQEEAALAQWSAEGKGGAECAHLLNVTFHAGREIRGEDATRLKRSKMGVKVARFGGKAARRAPVVPDEKEQEVVRKETADGIDFLSVGRHIRTIDELVAHVKLDLTKYEVHAPEATSWHTTMRDADTGQPVQVQNHRVHFKARLKAGPSVLEQVEAMIAAAFAARKPVKPRPVAVPKSATLLQALIIADPHIAKHAWGRETGHGDYDIAIAARILRESCGALLEAGDREPVARRAVWVLGDFFHYDTPNGQTTAGTPLERDGRVEKMLEEGVAVLVDVIDAAAGRGPVDVVLVPGNHDALMTVALRHILRAHFRGDPRVTVDAGLTTRKYVTFGKCLIGLTHGDKAQKKLGELMALEAREAWGAATYKEVHHGHKHADAEVTTVGGVVVRQHPALCPPDGWHAVEGYVGAPRRMWSFFYDRAGGDGALVAARSAGVR